MTVKVCRKGDILAGSGRVTWSLPVKEVAEERFGLGVGTQSSLIPLRTKGRAYRKTTKDPSMGFSYYCHLRSSAITGSVGHLDHLYSCLMGPLEDDRDTYAVEEETVTLIF